MTAKRKIPFSPPDISELEIEEVAKALAHRPNDASSSEHHAFIERLLLKIEALATTYPYLDFKNEIEQCNTQLAV